MFFLECKKEEKLKNTDLCLVRFLPPVFSSFVTYLLLLIYFSLVILYIYYYHYYYTYYNLPYRAELRGRIMQHERIILSSEIRKKIEIKRD